MARLISILSGFVLLMPSWGWAKIVEITGVAKADGKVVYIEKHEVEYASSGKLLRSKTKYESPDGKSLANLQSDFTTSLTVPDHMIEDFRSGDIEGLRRENGKLVMFDREKGRAEETRVLDDQEAEKRILIGCQGLNYYVLENLDKLEAAKPLPLRLLIPGKLDYYDFDMKQVKSKDPNIAEFEISIKNWFLRTFIAPKLYARYEKSTRRLVWYKGISNIKNEKGRNQVVTIEYTYKDQEENKLD